MTARVDGPYGRPALPLQEYTARLLVAGGEGRGVGVTPRESLAAAALAQGAPGEAALSLLWAVRQPEALTAWLPGWLLWLAACGVRVVVATTGAPAERPLLPLLPRHAQSAGGHAHEQLESGGLGCDTGVQLVRGRPDLTAAVAAAVADAHARGKDARDVAVFACGPPALVDAAAEAAAAAGCAFTAQHFGV